jgi:hypothetical protein
MPTNYRITIAKSEGAAPANGFIDNKRVEQYMAEGSIPTNLAASTAKERANLRYRRMIEQIQLLGNIYVSDIVAADADANTAPTTFVFTATVEHDVAGLRVEDATDPGTYLTGMDALERQISTALIAGFSQITDTFDPTIARTPGNILESARFGHRIAQIVVDPPVTTYTAANALITIVAL